MDGNFLNFWIDNWKTLHYVVKAAEGAKPRAASLAANQWEDQIQLAFKIQLPKPFIAWEQKDFWLTLTQMSYLLSCDNSFFDIWQAT